MANTEITIKEGTHTYPPMRVKVESGTREDGTKYEVHQNYAPPTFLSQVTDSKGKNVETRLDEMQTQIDGATTEIAQTVNDVVTQRASEDIATKDEIINDNLLKNSNSKLNTNGLSEYVGADTYTIDKWFLHQGTTMTVLNKGVKLASDGDETNFWMIHQDIENWSDYIGKTVTYSVKYANYSGESVRINIYDGVSESATVLTNGDGIATITHTVKDNATRLTVIVTKELGVTLSIDIIHVKLELGSLATEYVEPDIEIEKVRCGVADYLKQEVQSTNVEEAKFLVDALGHFMLFVKYKDGTIKILKLWNDSNEVSVDVYDPITNDWSIKRPLAFADSVLPLTGGVSIITNIYGGDCPVVFKGSRSATPERAAVGFSNIEGTFVDYIVFDNGVPKIVTTRNEVKESTILHTGNSNPIIQSTSAPTDTTYLWYDTNTNKVKAYKDGAWQ